MGLKKGVWRNLALLSQLGFSVMAPIFLCIFLGLFLERRFQINITIILLFLGIMAGGRNGYLLAKKAADQEDEDESKD